MQFTRLLRRIDRWDYNISSNRFSTEVWERSYPAGFETLEVGYPRNDRLATASPPRRPSSAASSTCRMVPGWCCSLPPSATTATPSIPRSTSPPSSTRSVQTRSCSSARTTSSTATTPSSQRRRRAGYATCRSYPSIEDLCIVSDALLTDYSSVMFDYALLDRPIAIYAYDWDTYVRTRGVNFDLLAQPPGVVATTADELIGAFRDGDVWSAEAAVVRAAFRERFCEFDDGHAAEQVVRRVFLGERLVNPRRSSSPPRSPTRRPRPRRTRGCRKREPHGHRMPASRDRPIFILRVSAVRHDAAARDAQQPPRDPLAQGDPLHQDRRDARAQWQDLRSREARARLAAEIGVVRTTHANRFGTPKRSCCGA